MYGLIEKYKKFMAGRNGFDRLTPFTFLAYLLINGLKMFFAFSKVAFFIMWAIALVFIGVTIYRFLSKNVEKRRAEVSRFSVFLFKIDFEGFLFRMRKKFKRMAVRLSQIKTHRFRTCPGCKEHLRLSKKRGVRRITCPKCGKKFKRFILF